MNRRSFLGFLPCLPYAGKLLILATPLPVTVTLPFNYEVMTVVERWDETLDVTRVDVFDRYEYSWKHIT
jgi:hypothetical protein